ncbi:MAG: DUF427 domain-containing protein [Paracoccaceae bacterium]
MADHIRIAPAPGTWVVRAGGAELGRTGRAMELREGSYPPVIYFPRENMTMSFFARSNRASTCPHKGHASYFSIRTPDAELPDSVWSYESPKPGVEAIAGYLAFYTDRVSVGRA